MRKTSIFTILILSLAAMSAAQRPAAMFHQAVAWSSDGKYLAFSGMHDFDEARHTFKADIYVMRADGTGLKNIGSTDKNEFYTAWSKNRVYFGVEDPVSKGSNIYSSRKDGSDLRQVTNSSGRNSTPTVSRDGKLIAFVSTRESEKYQIYIASSDGSGVRRLTTDATLAYFNPEFSPDGKRIVYYAEKGDGKDQVWVMNNDGSDQKLLTGNIGHNIFPGWSADGKQIIFSSSKRDTDSSGSYIDGSYLYLMNADGSNLRKVGDIKSFYARFSPDGKHIAYISGKFPSTSIFVAKADGSAAAKISGQ